MPKINRQFYLEVTPEQFLEACSPTELKELDMLLGSSKYQNIIYNSNEYSRMPKKTDVVKTRFCQACASIRSGVKTRIALTHTCGKDDTPNFYKDH